MKVPHGWENLGIVEFGKGILAINPTAAEARH
jgi:hypothetical protein